MMKRRIALRDMALIMGYTITAPTLLALVQGCKTESNTGWKPNFFTDHQRRVLTKLVDIILPKTDTPSASEVKVDIFIDRFAFRVMDLQQQEFIKMSMDHFIELAYGKSQTSRDLELGSRDLKAVFAHVLNVSNTNKTLYKDRVNTHNEAIAQSKSSKLDREAAAYAFADSLRGLVIWGYKTSEFVGEQVLAYLPVPGSFIGCADLQALSKGKDWSL